MCIIQSKVARSKYKGPIFKIDFIVRTLKPRFFLTHGPYKGFNIIFQRVSHTYLNTMIFWKCIL